jgi:hypothetical protein
MLLSELGVVMARRFSGNVLGLFLCLAPYPALCAEPSAIELAAAHEAQERGAQMFGYDQAAWHATDRFQADLKAVGKTVSDPELALAGYIVEPADAGRLLVSFYAGQGADTRARARYFFDPRKGLEGGVEGGVLAVDADAAMSPLALRMIAARRIALDQAAKPGHGLCSTSLPNSLILPPGSDGKISVYVLTSTSDHDVYPAGGHYRFDIAADGSLAAERGFMKSCFPIDLRKIQDKKPAAMVLSHLLHPQPTEIHAFVSRNIPVRLMILTTSNRLIWSVANGTVQFVDEVRPWK